MCIAVDVDPVSARASCVVYVLVVSHVLYVLRFRGFLSPLLSTLHILKSPFILHESVLPHRELYLGER